MNLSNFNKKKTKLSAQPLRTTLLAMFKASPIASVFQVLAAALGVGLLSYEPVLIKGLFDSIAKYQSDVVTNGHTNSEILSNFFLVCFVWASAFLVNIVQEIIERVLAPAAQKEIQSTLFKYAVNQSSTYLNTKNVGYITQSIKQAGPAVATLITLLSYDFVRLLVTTGMALYVSTKLPNGFLTIISAWTIAYYVTCYWFARQTFPKFKIFSSVGAKSAGIMGDILSNIELVRSFSKTSDEVKLVDRELGIEKGASEENRRYIILMNLIVYGGAILFQVIFVYYSIVLFNKGALTLGDVALAISLAAILVNNASGLCRQLLSFFEQTGNLSNAFGAIGYLELEDSNADIPQKEITSGRIKFQNVTFKYENGRTIFKDVSLSISHGEKVGIVGHSGAAEHDPPFLYCEIVAT